MLNVQKYLHDHSLDELSESRGIKVALHPDLPLVILNYSHINSQKNDTITRECRGLVLERDTWRIVSRSFFRFFNWGEMQDEMPLFDFRDCCCQTKEDGSLASVFHYDGSWMVTTRGSFAQDNLEFQDFTWERGMCEALGIDDLQDLDLDPSLSYACEFVSPWNKVVRHYAEPKMFLLTVFDGENELSVDDVDMIWKDNRKSYFFRPQRFGFKSIDDVQTFLHMQASVDPTFEGVVLRDRHNHRWKVKSETFVALHHLRGEQGNLFNPNHLLPFILSNNAAGVLDFFPEATDAYRAAESKVNAAYDTLRDVWLDSRRITDQKTFALSIIGRTPFTGILFRLKKSHEDHSVEALRKLWLESGDLIIKNLF